MHLSSGYRVGSFHPNRGLLFGGPLSKDCCSGAYIGVPYFGRLAPWAPNSERAEKSRTGRYFSLQLYQGSEG